MFFATERTGKQVAATVCVQIFVMRFRGLERADRDVQCAASFNERVRELLDLKPQIGKNLAARLGLEPRQNESESFVLPLHHRAKNCRGRAHAFGRATSTWTASGAGDGIRTRNRLFTKQVLYR